MIEPCHDPSHQSWVRVGVLVEVVIRVRGGTWGGGYERGDMRVRVLVEVVIRVRVS